MQEETEREEVHLWLPKSISTHQKQHYQNLEAHVEEVDILAKMLGYSKKLSENRILRSTTLFSLRYDIRGAFMAERFGAVEIA